MSFPPASVGLCFAIVETFGGLLNFAAEPIVEWISKTEISNFYYVSIGVAFAMVLVNFVTVPLAFEKGPRFFHKLDSARSKTVFAMRVEELQEEKKKEIKNLISDSE